MLESQKLFREELQERLEGFAEVGLHSEAVFSLLVVLYGSIHGIKRSGRSLRCGPESYKILATLRDLMDEEKEHDEGFTYRIIRDLRSGIVELARGLATNLPDFAEQEAKYKTPLSEVESLRDALSVGATTPKPYQKSKNHPTGKQKLGYVLRNAKQNPLLVDAWLPNEDVPMTTRLRLCLANAHLTLEDTTKKTADQLLSIRSFGEKSLVELDDILESQGLPRHRPR